MAHTPGPWEFIPSSYYGYSTLWNPETRQEIITTDGRNDGDHPITWMGEELQPADAYLIEAAPDMIAALKALHARYVSVIGNEGPEAYAARIAIEKAERR